MSSDESVSRWIDELKAGRETVATELWNHFYRRLIGLARQKLRAARKRTFDEEDLVVSAFETFFRRAREGRFPRLQDRDDLWHLLVRITEHKAQHLLRDQNRQKRGGGKVRGESAFGEQAARDGLGIEQLAGAEPTPEFAAIIAEDFRRLLDLLGDDDLRQIAMWKLEGYSNDDIAAKAHRSLPTVERRLKLIREKWRNAVS